MTNTTASVDAPHATFGDLTDPRPAFAHAAEVCSIVIDAVTPDQLGRPTPCDAMEVRQLMAHLVMVANRVACAGRGDDPSSWPGEITDLPDADLAATWHRDAAVALAPWADDAVLDRITALPWGTFTGGQTLATYVNELVVHTWDLAQATGQLPTWDDGALQVAHTAIVGQLPDADRTERWAAVAASMPEGVPFDGPFANAVAIDEDAPLIDRLIAWNGRQP